MQEKIIFATGNEGKMKEIRMILADMGLPILSMKEAGVEAQIRARSGLAIRHGICLINGVGTVDSDYRGEWNVALVNLGQEPFTISDGDRIAQVVFARCTQADFQRAEIIDETERGDGGFGHTGVK